MLYVVNNLPEDYLVLTTGLVTIPFILLFAVLEHYFPEDKNWNTGRNDTLSDLIRTFIVLPISSKLGELLIISILYYPISLLSDKFNFSLLSDQHILIKAAVTLIFCEFLYYWIHRLSHNSSFLWRFHSVHHGAERVYWGNSGRFHLIDGLLGNMAYFIPIIILGCDEKTIAIILTFSALSGTLEHVNIEFNSGILKYIFNTAEHHRWHHSKVISESNKNFGKALIIWDLIFGSFHFKKDKKPNQIGVDQESVPNSFLKQSIYPFLKRK